MLGTHELDVATILNIRCKMFSMLQMSSEKLQTLCSRAKQMCSTFFWVFCYERCKFAIYIFVLLHTHIFVLLHTHIYFAASRCFQNATSMCWLFFWVFVMRDVDLLRLVSICYIHIFSLLHTHILFVVLELSKCFYVFCSFNSRDLANPKIKIQIPNVSHLSSVAHDHAVNTMGFWRDG